MKIVSSYHFKVFHADRANLLQDLMAVLTQDCNGEYAVYLGAWSPMSGDAYAPHRENVKAKIAVSGDKQCFEAAKGFFPSLKQTEYRA